MSGQMSTELAPFSVLIARPPLLATLDRRLVHNPHMTTRHIGAVTLALLQVRIVGDFFYFVHGTSWNLHARLNTGQSLREYNGLSVDLHRPNEYEKLSISLISSLPNEQDFAINVCTLLSNEGKHTLKLEKNKTILHFLLAHAAVFSHSSLRVLFAEHYGKVRGHSNSRFWEDVLSEPDFQRLTDEARFNVKSADGVVNKLFNNNHNKDYVQCIKRLTVEAEDKELFCLGRTLGTQDYIGQRWNNLHQVGWDMLGNVASEVTVQCPLIDDILNLTTRGLMSEDRAVILAALEILNKLGQNESNEEILLRFLDHSVYERVLSFLTLHDIMLLVYTLECLNSISSLGEKACNSIIRVRGALDTLVSLITVEAQSYGPRACIQMRVVETVTGGTVTQPTQSSTVSSTMGVTPQPPPPPPPPPPVPTQPTTITVLPPNVSSQTSTTMLTPTALQPAPSAPPVRVQNNSNNNNSNTSASHATQQVAQENEQFALAWLRNTFELNPAGKIEQAELYKQYITYCAKIGRRGVIAPLHFPRCVRSVFGGSVGPKSASGEASQHYEGIQLRVKPIIAQAMSQSHLASSNSVQPTTPSPILKAQLSAPPKPTPPATAAPKALIGGGGSPPSGDQGTTSLIKTLLATKVTDQHQLQDQVTQRQQRLLLQQQSPSTSASPNSLGNNNVLADKVPVATNITSAAITIHSNKSAIAGRLNGIRASLSETGSFEIKSENSNESENIVTSTVVENHVSRPPPLAPLSNTSRISNKTNLTSMAMEETDSTGNSIASSSGIRDNYSATGGEEGENSMSSLDGFLINGVPNSLDVDDTTSKDSTPKSMMLADLLEKNLEKNEPPVLNGSLRIGEKGLELIQGKEERAINTNGSVDVNLNGTSGTVVIGVDQNLDLPKESLKRPAEDDREGENGAKKLHMNGDIKQEPPEEGNVSSTAANLYAALAADTLEDEPIEDVPTQPPVLVTPTQPRQILVTAAAAGQLTQRVVVGGQHYVVAQPQTALVQGQTQTVLVAQTAQQQGTGAKTIIILQPQGVAGNTTQKVIVQRLQSPPPPPLLPTSTSTTSPIRPSTPPKPPPTPPLVQSPKPQPVKVAKPAPISSSVQNVNVLNSHANSSNSANHLHSVPMPVIPAPCATPVCVTSTSPTPNICSKEVKPLPKIPSEQGHFLCEWRGCMRNFKSGNEVYMHACEAHCPQGSQEIQCLWERCDAMKRKRFSLMTHLYDRHCNADLVIHHVELVPPNTDLEAVNIQFGYRCGSMIERPQ
ncbi:hypothetical protein AAG570_007855 [Ranatra chinensis]|uniref:RFX-type winged-helix domain-containing protein n=1 Tax=Ranatra chinensis TaxID=642074 RepID=A0ABD0XUG7_9HEMI